MATISITTTSPQDARIATAFGHYLGLPTDATAPQVKAAVIAYIVSIVRADEERVAALAAAGAVTSITPT